MSCVRGLCPLPLPSFCRAFQTVTDFHLVSCNFLFKLNISHFSEGGAEKLPNTIRKWRWWCVNHHYLIISIMGLYWTQQLLKPVTHFLWISVCVFTIGWCIGLHKTYVWISTYKWTLVLLCGFQLDRWFMRTRKKFWQSWKRVPILSTSWDINALVRWLPFLYSQLRMISNISTKSACKCSNFVSILSGGLDTKHGHRAF